MAPTTACRTPCRTEPTMPWKVRWGAHQARGSLRPECAKQTGPISVPPTANGQTLVDRWVLYCVLRLSKHRAAPPFHREGGPGPPWLARLDSDRVSGRNQLHSR